MSIVDVKYCKIAFEVRWGGELKHIDRWHPCMKSLILVMNGCICDMKKFELEKAGE